jgi:stage V sporulation protein K
MGEITMDNDAALIKQAIEIVQQSSRASISLLQRKLRIGYSIAAKLIDQLEVLGIVGPDEGPTKGRAVLHRDKPIASSASASQQPTSSQTAQPQTLVELLNELNFLVGLETIKKGVAELINFLKVQQLRKAKGLMTAPMTLHHVFYGNPGTGKTTVARLLAQIFKSMNLLSKGHLVETDRAGLIAGYVGQTALKVTEVVNEALGGVLFIDEAYSLAGQGQDYGQEAIETLLKQMEDHRDDLIVIVAGYTDRMNEFLSSNPGLRSRFNKYLRFDDYTPLQLVAIFESFCAKAGYYLSVTTGEKLQFVFTAAYAKRDKTFGNARFARNLFERTISNQANRVVTITNATPLVFSTIEPADIPDKIADDLT